MFYYFGYGSNMNITSLRAKGVEPVHSCRAELPGWVLRFNVEHFFRHEGGMGNIEKTGQVADRVLGVLHECPDSALSALDEAEAYGIGYDRIEVEVKTAIGLVCANVYVGYPEFINDGCQPTRRYLNILVSGAKAAQIDAEYIDDLMGRETVVKQPCSSFDFSCLPHKEYTVEEIEDQPMLTGLYGAVFDMSNARPRHDFVRSWFGAKDMTLFHLKRMDTSTGSETYEDIRQNRLDEKQLEYLNEYLIEYSREYQYAGRVNY